MEKCVVVLFIRKDDKVLGVSRKDDPTDFGLPGGKVEEGEGLKEAARREVREETGIKDTKLEMLYNTVDNNGYEVTAFLNLADVSDQEIYSDEQGVVKWVDRQTLCEGSFGDYNKDMFAVFDLLTSVGNPFEI